MYCPVCGQILELKEAKLARKLFYCKNCNRHLELFVLYGNAQRMEWTQ